MRAIDWRSGCAIFTPSAAAATKPHRRQPARRDERAGYVDRKLLADTVLVPAHVGDDERILGGGASQLAEDAFGPQRELIGRSTDRPSSRRTPCGRGRSPRAAAAIGVPLAARLVDQRRQRQLRVGDDAELGLVVAANLREIGVDVNQPRRRNGRT